MSTITPAQTMTYAQAIGHVDAIGEAIIQWARPKGGKWQTSPLALHPLADFRSAAAIAVGYLLFVLVFSALMCLVRGPIKNLYGLKFLYNIIQVMLCSYMCIEAGVQAWRHSYTLLPCQPFNHAAPVMGDILYIFYLSKILDFADTFFIIAEKRWKQLSFLHVYHHFSIFLFYWLNVTVGYDGDVYLTIVLNGLIHTIMYTYYFITLHNVQPWWKSALTMGQMIQFVLMNAQAGYLLVADCPSFPRRITEAYLYYILTLLALFMDFFIRSYVLSSKSKLQRKGDKGAASSSSSANGSKGDNNDNQEGAPSIEDQDPNPSTARNNRSNSGAKKNL